MRRAEAERLVVEAAVVKLNCVLLKLNWMNREFLVTYIFGHLLSTL